MLRLIFTCCHPALGRAAQVALALRTLARLEVRTPARTDAGGNPVTLAGQDRSRWHRAAIAEGSAWLSEAVTRSGGAAGPYQIQAHLAAAHSTAPSWQDTQAAQGGAPVFSRVLGAIEVAEDGTALPLGGPRQRSVLADLVLHVGQTVSTAQLIVDVWGECSPATAIHTVETYVSRLRQVLSTSSSAAPLLTRPTGYLLDAPPDHVDIWQFRDLAAKGSAAAEQGDATAAVSQR